MSTVKQSKTSHGGIGSMSGLQKYISRKDVASNLVEIIADYPDQLVPIIDELTYKLNQTQLEEIEDLIVNHYGEEL